MTRPAKAYPVTVTPTNLLVASGMRDDWSDCQRQPVSAHATTDPSEWARHLFHDPPTWVASALTLRDRVVSHLGLRTSVACSSEQPCSWTP